ALRRYNRQQKTSITIRHSKYLNNIVEQDQRAVKRVVRPMLGFKSFWAARCTIAGIEVMHAIRKGQLIGAQEMGRTPAEQFYTLHAKRPPGEASYVFSQNFRHNPPHTAREAGDPNANQLDANDEKEHGQNHSVVPG